MNQKQTFTEKKKALQNVLGVSRVEDPDSVQIFVNRTDDEVSFILVIDGRIHSLNEDVFERLEKQVMFCGNAAYPVSSGKK